MLRGAIVTGRTAGTRSLSGGSGGSHPQAMGHAVRAVKKNKGKVSLSNLGDFVESSTPTSTSQRPVWLVAGNRELVTI